MQEGIFFSDRNEAGKILAKQIERFRKEPCIVLALPRGGLPIGYEIAKSIGVPLDIILVRKIGAPWNPELAVGAVVNGTDSEVVLNNDLMGELSVTKEYIEKEKTRQLEEIERRRTLYRKGNPSLNLNGKTIIVVDDGVATGSTMLAALHSLRKKDVKKIVVAVPVASEDAVNMLKTEADEVICLYTPEVFFSVGTYYEDFPQLNDEDVIRILNTSKL